MIKTDAPDTIDRDALPLANISKSYSGVAALTDVSVRSGRARCTPSSARTAPASRP